MSAIVTAISFCLKNKKFYFKDRHRLDQYSPKISFKETESNITFIIRMLVVVARWSRGMILASGARDPGRAFP